MARQARSALVALDILEVLQVRGEEPIGVSEVARKIGINKATSHTVLKMLESRGYATQDPETREFRRGPSLWSLGVTLVGTANPVDLARAELEAASARTNAMGSLSRHVGDGTVQIILHVGGAFDTRRMYRRTELVTFPSGLASVFLAWEGTETARKIYTKWKSANSAAKGDLGSLARYMKYLEAIRRDGYNTGIHDTPFPDVVVCFTEAPVFDRSGKPVFVVTLTTLASSRNTVPRYYPEETKRIAATITRAIGGQAPAVLNVSQRPRPEPKRAETRKHAARRRSSGTVAAG